MSNKRINKIREISKKLLEENKIDNFDILEKEGFRLTNFYSDNVFPIGMLNEDEIALLRSYFRDRLNDYYYVEKI